MLPAILPRLSLEKIARIFPKVEVREETFMIRARHESVIHRVKIDDGVIHTIKAGLIHQIETVPIAHAEPWRSQNLVNSAADKPVGVYFFGKRFNPFQHSSPIEMPRWSGAGKSFDRDG